MRIKSDVLKNKKGYLTIKDVNIGEFGDYDVVADYAVTIGKYYAATLEQPAEQENEVEYHSFVVFKGDDKVDFHALPDDLQTEIMLAVVYPSDRLENELYCLASELGKESPY